MLHIPGTESAYDGRSRYISFLRKSKLPPPIADNGMSRWLPFLASLNASNPSIGAVAARRGCGCRRPEGGGLCHEPPCMKDRRAYADSRGSYKVDALRCSRSVPSTGGADCGSVVTMGMGGRGKS